MSIEKTGRLINILMVEDNPDDVELTIEAIKDVKTCNNIHVVRDGVEALDFLHRKGKYADAPRPDLILLDLNLPRKNGREVLVEIKSDEKLRRIPVVVLTLSQAEEDILKSYDLHANCYITKPVGFNQFIKVIKDIQNFWLSIVTLPSEVENNLLTPVAEFAKNSGKEEMP